MRSGYALIIGLGVIGSLVTINAGAAPPLSAQLPVASKAIDGWQLSRKVGLAPSARALVEAQIKKSANSVAASANVATDSVDRASTGPIYDYLDHKTLSRSSTIDLESLMGSPFGARGGLGTTEVQQMGRIKLVYTKPVDNIRVANQDMPPWPELLAETGSVMIAGVARGHIVCTGNVQVTPVAEVQFRC